MKKTVILICLQLSTFPMSLCIILIRFVLYSSRGLHDSQKT
ncbi:Uncharacterised protein [Klebsiella variicola]|nr:Uncharacterised protein [Klebsiella variicola]VAR93171.1 Uncharacterised protein [Klebsiella variicola]